MDYYSFNHHYIIFTYYDHFVQDTFLLGRDIQIITDCFGDLSHCYLVICLQHSSDNYGLTTGTMEWVVVLWFKLE